MILIAGIFAIVTATAVVVQQPVEPKSSSYCEKAVIMGDTVSRCRTYGVTHDTGLRVEKERK